MKKIDFAIRKLSLGIAASLLATVPIFNITTTAYGLSGSDFNAGRIIDDHVFSDSTTMAAGDIQAFLNSKVPVCDTWHAPNGSNTPPFTCLKDYRQDTPSRQDESGLCNGFGAGNKSAAQIIFEVAQSCGVNPRVLITLLQKEQSLVTDTWPWTVQYRSATGFGCPDTAACDSQYYGFFNQVYAAARQFKRYARDPQNYNYRAGRNNFILYSPSSACSGSNIYIQNQATASLYNYTPYQPNAAALANLYGTGDSCSSYGNRNFWRIYNDWFGSPVSSHCFFNPPASPITGITFRKQKYRYLDQADFVIYSGSSTNCIESHTWAVGVNAWASHTATNHPIAPPDQANVQYADLNGDGFDEPILVGLKSTGSGFVEFHIWNTAMNRWQDHIISPLPAGGDYAKAKLTFADVNGDRKDEPILIIYSGTGSGNIEFHVMNSDLRTWRWRVASQSAALDPTNGTINFADIDGNGVDDAVLALYKGTGSDMVEFHTWNPGWASWRFHTASNLSVIDPANGFITFADVDGNGVDDAVLIATRGTASGRVEFHTWHLGVTAWRFHTASNQPAL